MRRVLLLALLPLVGCASPQERCISSATKDIRVISKLIATTQGNLDRGYGIRTEEFFVTEEQVCGVVEGENVYCDVPVADSRRVPYALDLAAENAKLKSLVTKRNQLTQQANSVIAQCRAVHPEV